MYIQFKYISCSYLSNIEVINSFLSKNLNTSHVLIYQEVEDKRVTLLKFKYISCSYLSGYKMSGTGYVDRFKYISCSYLSIHTSIIHYLQNHLNTSHVLIYQSRENGKIAETVI